MGQNEMIFYIVAAGCMICLVLLLRGAFCAMIVYGISIVCMRKGITAPVNLNILSIGTGALLGLPGIIALYAAAVFLLQ